MKGESSEVKPASNDGIRLLSVQWHCPCFVLFCLFIFYEVEHSTVRITSCILSAWIPPIDTSKLDLWPLTFWTRQTFYESPFTLLRKGYSAGSFVGLTQQQPRYKKMNVNTFYYKWLNFYTSLVQEMYLSQENNPPQISFYRGRAIGQQYMMIVPV